MAGREIGPFQILQSRDYAEGEGGNPISGWSLDRNSGWIKSAGPHPSKASDDLTANPKG